MNEIPDTDIRLTYAVNPIPSYGTLYLSYHWLPQLAGSAQSE